MTGASDDPSPSPAAAIAEELHGFVRKARRRLRDQADTGDLTFSQTAALLHLEANGPSTTSALARAEGMRPQSMGAVVATLESMGLVAGAPDPTDGRQTLISMTEHCRRWLVEGRAARRNWLSRTLETRLSPDELAQLAAVMPLLQRLVDP